MLGSWDFMVLSSDNDTGIVYTFQVPQPVIRQRLQITRSIETYAYPEIISICVTYVWSWIVRDIYIYGYIINEFLVDIYTCGSALVNDPKRNLRSLDFVGHYQQKEF